MHQGGDGRVGYGLLLNIHLITSCSGSSCLWRYDLYWSLLLEAAILMLRNLISMVYTATTNGLVSAGVSTVESTVQGGNQMCKMWRQSREGCPDQ